MYLHVFLFRKGPSVKYVRNWWGDGWSFKTRTAVYRGGGVTFCFTEFNAKVSPKSSGGRVTFL